ncbi:MAG: hypothetical protein K5880_22515 [Hydrogenophaga sp.]|jgi:hypothetical protein|uniref:hypothetical protein n=1 Tax=Hydrogenophaga sp. TaxID=1904254 RepID=UPI002639B95B|nr:hypothetical protein [Hydrogenophaga sp.]MCV0441378.1 hypothetical protein [Hydrogenophaga sp.]
MNTFPHSLWSRLRRSVGAFFRRVTTGPSDGLEAYLSTARSLHQLEDMQRRWDRAHRGRHTFGAH